MKLFALSIFKLTIAISFWGCNNGDANLINYNKQGNLQAKKIMDTFEYSFNTAHPNARALMAEDFFWSPIEETGPFGSDEGWDAAYGFRQWRFTNKSKSPISYVKELIAYWKYPLFDWKGNGYCKN